MEKKFWIIRNQIRDLLVDGLFTLTSVRDAASVWMHAVWIFFTLKMKKLK